MASLPHGINARSQTYNSIFQSSLLSYYAWLIQDGVQLISQVGSLLQATIMVLNPKAVLLALWALLLSASYQATAYPELFVVEQARDQCSNHPTRAFGKHKAPTASRYVD